MKASLPSPFLPLLLLTAALPPIAPAGTNQYWNVGGTGGNGIWGTSPGDKNWNTTPGGAVGTNTFWPDTIDDIAVFDDALGGTVIVFDPVQTAGIVQAGADYMVNAATITLVEDSAMISPFIDVQTGTLSIDSPLAGTAGMRKTGTGSLVLSSANTYTGTTSVEAGNLSLTGSLAGSTLDISMGATFDNQSGGLAAGTAVTNAGTLDLNADNTVNTYLSNGGLLSGPGTLAASGGATLNDGSIVTGRLSGNTATSGTVDISGNVGGGVLDVNGGLTTISGTFRPREININSGQFTLTGAATTRGFLNINVDPGAHFENSATDGIDFRRGTLTGSGGTISGPGLSIFRDVDLNGDTLSGNVAGNSVTLNDGTTVSGSLLTDLVTTNGNVSVTGLLGGGTLTRGGTSVSFGPRGRSITIVSGGTLTLTAGGQLTHRRLNIATGATIDDQNAGIYDGAAVTNNGGTLTVTGTDTVNTYRSNGGLLDGTGTLTASSYDLNDNSTVTGNLGNGPVTADGLVVISGTTGTGPFTVGSGTTTNSGNIGGDVVVNGGTMDNDGEIAGNVENNSTFNNNGTGTLLGNLDNNATAANAGVILGNADNSGDLGNSNLIVGNLVNSGGFTNTGAVNGTTANTGTLVNTGTGFLLGDVTNSSGLTTDADGIGDTATLTNNAGGIVTLNGDDTIATYTSNAGTLQGPGTLTAATYALNNNSVVDGNLGTGTLNANGTVTYPGTSMADTVNIQSGITSLTGAGQFGMHTSLFDISGGARVDLGGADYRFTTIQGAGTAGGNLLIGGGDSIYPGTNGTVGTFHVDGNLTVMGTPGSDANVGIDVLSPAPGGYDVISVSGDLTLGSDSHLMVNNPGGIDTLPAPIQVIGVTGSRAGIFTSTNLLGAFGTLHVYNPAAGTIQPLNLAPSVAKSSYLIGNLNQNQSAGYRALFEDVVDVGFQNIIQVFYDGATGMPLPPGAIPGYEDYFLLELAPGSPLIQDGDPQLRDALNATPLPGGGLSGAVLNLLLPEVHQGMADFTEQSMRGLVRLATRTAPVAEAGKTKIFAGVHSTKAGSTDSTTNASYDISLAGVVTGARYEVAPGFQIGALLGYDDGSIEGPLVDTDGSGYVLGVFGEYVIDQPSQTTVFASLSYGDYEYDAARTSFGGLAAASGIGADALEFAVGIRGVGYEQDNFRLIPNATLRYMSGDVDGFTESGSGVPLWVSGYDFDSLLLEIGVDAELEVNDVVTVAGHIGFQTDFSDSGNSIGASFANGMAPFTVLAPGIDDEAFVIAAAAYFDVTEDVRLSINWRSELRDSSQSMHSIGIGASFGF